MLSEPRLLELLSQFSHVEGVPAVAEAVRGGEYCVWSRRGDLLDGSDDRRIVVEVLLWTVTRIVGDLEEHGEEHANSLYEGHSEEFFRARLAELQQNTDLPRSALSRELAAHRLAESPRDHFLRLKDELQGARKAVDGRAFASAVHALDSVSSDLVTSWLDNLVVEATAMCLASGEGGDSSECEDVIRALLSLQKGPHGSAINRRLRHRRKAGALGAIAQQIADASDDQDLKTAIRETFAVPNG